MLKKLLITILVLPLMASAIYSEMPHSITYEVLEGKHVYTIRGLLPIKAEKDYKSCIIKRVLKKYPTLENVDYDLDEDLLRIVSSELIKDLPDIVNDISENTMLIPLWDEIKCRDYKSTEYDSDFYRLVFQSKLTSEECPIGEIYSFEKTSENIYSIIGHSGFFGLKSYYLYTKKLVYNKGNYSIESSCDSKPIEDDILISAHNKNYPAWDDTISINYEKDTEGYLAFNLHSEYCMCGYRFSMRLFSKDKKYIWVDSENTYIQPLIFCLDITHDGVDEIVLLRTSHKILDIFIYERNWGDIIEED